MVGESNADLKYIKNKVIGSILVNSGLSNIVNNVRELLKDDELSDDERYKLVSMARSILNLDDEQQIHLDLNSVYKSINFDNYPSEWGNKKNLG